MDRTARSAARRGGCELQAQSEPVADTAPDPAPKGGEKVVMGLFEYFGVSRQAMSKLLNGCLGPSAEMAVHLEKAFGLKAETFCRMQTAYDLAEARQHEKKIKMKPFCVAA